MERCPQCEGLSLKTWEQLTEAERMVAESRPAPDYQDLEHRRQNHYWCTRCWGEWHGCGDRYV